MPRIGYVGQGTNFRRLLNHSPEISAAYWGLRKTINETSVLSAKLRMLSFLASDVANRCRYWLHAHTVAGRALGITQEMVDAIGAADASPLFSDAEKALLAASTELTRTASLSDATFARLQAFFDERAMVELVVNTSIANLNNRVTDAFTADVEDEE